MFENRISGFFAETESRLSASVEVPSNTAFVACPLPMFVGFGASQAVVAEVYRKAQELTEAQLRKPARRTIPAFSLN